MVILLLDMRLRPLNPGLPSLLLLKHYPLIPVHLFLSRLNHNGEMVAMEPPLFPGKVGLPLLSLYSLYSQVGHCIQHIASMPMWVGEGGICVKGRSTSHGLSKEPAQEDANSCLGMVIGRSEIMYKIAMMVRQVAESPTTTVLLQGESGTGKDVVARAIHTLSRRRSAYQFVDINCAAIPDTLLETELFGVEPGAFTDAKVLREGYLLRADGGTLFLDEIGSMPLVLQAKLLRFLETRSFRRVGGTKEIHVDLRVISATNVDLKTAVAHHAFREDLFYRLDVITLTLPPLRERPEDV